VLQTIKQYLNYKNNHIYIYIYIYIVIVGGREGRWGWGLGINQRLNPLIFAMNFHYGSSAKAHRLKLGSDLLQHGQFECEIHSWKCAHSQMTRISPLMNDN
jgi:hypothetical protein